MKLTWFGGTTLRIHIGGLILVVDAASAPGGIDPAELVSGADRVFGLVAGDAGLPSGDLESWKAPRVSPLDADAPEAVILGGAPGVVLVHVDGERPLLLASGELPPLGRWAQEAMVVLLGDSESITRRGQRLLEQQPPKLVAIAASESAVDMAVPALAGRLDGTGLVALEAGLGLEV